MVRTAGLRQCAAEPGTAEKDGHTVSDYLPAVRVDAHGCFGCVAEVEPHHTIGGGDS
jgi:hypothetical protein